MISPWKKFLWFIFLIAMIVEGYLLYWVKEDAPVGMKGWEETSQPSRYYESSTPNPPYTISLDDKSLLVESAAQLISENEPLTEFRKIAMLRSWAREQCPEISLYSHTNDPSEILDAYKIGNGGACTSLAVLHCASLIAHGYRARIVQLVRDRMDVVHWFDNPVDTHVTVEVFSTEYQKWFVSDPTFNCWFRSERIEGPQSARDIQTLVVDANLNFSPTGWVPLAREGIIEPVYDGAITLPRIETYYIDPALLFNNIFLLYYDVYGQPPSDPWQKYASIIQARLLGTEKIVWVMPSGSKGSEIGIRYQTVTWIPVGMIVILVLIMAPSGKSRGNVEEEEEDEEGDEE